MSGTPRDELARFLRDDLQRAATEEEPIGDDQLEAYVDGTLDAVDREVIETRLDDDALLRAQVEDLRALRAAMGPAAPRVVSLAEHRAVRPASRRWVVPLGLAAAAMIAFAVVRTRSTPDPQVPAPTPAPPASAGMRPRAGASTPVLEIRDRDRSIGVTADNRLIGVDGIAPDLAARLAATLRTGRLPVSTLGAQVAAPGGVLMSPDAGGVGGTSGASGASGTRETVFRPIAPVATAVVTARPLLRWTPRAGARAYRVRIVDERLQTVAESPRLATLAWRPTSPLPTGRVLTWQIEADTPDGPQTTPAPPLPEARFAVLGAADAARVQAAMRAATSDLAAAVIAAEAGLHDDADATLQRLAHDNPGAAVVAALQRDLAARRHGPRRR